MKQLVMELQVELWLWLAHWWVEPGPGVASCDTWGPGASVDLMMGGTMTQEGPRADVSLLVGGTDS